MTRKTLLIGLVAVALVACVYFVVAAAAKPDDDSTSASAGTGGQNLDETPSGNSAASSGAGSDFPLKVGSRGSNVRTWQDYLFTQQHGITTVGRVAFCDGIFGPKTLAATKAVTGTTTVSLAQFLDAVDTAKGGSFAATLSGVGGVSATS